MDFNWSLKPLKTFLQCVGIHLNWKKKKPPIKVLIIFLAIVLANLISNGSRGIENSRFKFMSGIYSAQYIFRDTEDKYGSPFYYLKINRFAIVKLVGIIAGMAFFCYVPFIHVAFVVTILFDPNWKKLIRLLDNIQRKMKLDEEFHRKCRRICFVALFQLGIVSG